MKITIIVALAATLSSAAANANLVANGSFELGVSIGQFCANNLNSGPGLITAWTVSAGNIDYCRDSLWNASDGHRSVDLSGSSSRGSISQDIQTIVGETYSIDFDLSGNPGGSPTTKTVTVSAAGTSGNFAHNEPNATVGFPPPSPWRITYERISWSFVALNSVTEITFSSASSNSASFGPVIDNVNVELVPHSGSQLPEPQSLLLVAAAAIAYFVCKRHALR
jgi:choice-of-anchor C domain-containing protein